MEIRKDKLNVIAFYLPQFHTIPENDEAYGKGFTEWTNVKKAKPLFEGHRQPRIPLDDNYYCLLDNGKTMEWQVKLAKENGVFGFCYYHYYFSDGKKLLEKPLEEMLENKKIDMPFCLCWANENWTRRWDGGNNEVIAEQTYDDIAGIEKHVEYLSRFLRDERYITIDGKPILIVYKPELIPNLKKYLREIRLQFKKQGFSSIALVCQYPTYYFNKRGLALFDYYIQFEPIFIRTNNLIESHKFKFFIKRQLLRLKLDGLITYLSKRLRFKKTSELTRANYDKDWESILNYKINDPRLIAGCFVDWDNTPRNKRGLMYEGASPAKFEEYFRALSDKVKNEYSLPITFITAWNEWGEGSYLEPDKENGTGYLEAIKKNV